MKTFFAVLGAVLLVCALPAAAGDPALGRHKAIKCKQCHGLDGIGTLPVYPNIAGQKEEYLVIQMRAFRDGERANDMMTFIAQDLSDEDIVDLAAYYAAIKVVVTSPE